MAREHEKSYHSRHERTPNAPKLFQYLPTNVLMENNSRLKRLMNHLFPLHANQNDIKIRRIARGKFGSVPVKFIQMPKLAFYYKRKKKRKTER